MVPRDAAIQDLSHVPVKVYVMVQALINSTKIISSPGTWLEQPNLPGLGMLIHSGLVHVLLTSGKHRTSFSTD